MIPNRSAFLPKTGIHSRDVVNQKPQKNPRYSHIRSSINNGRAKYRSNNSRPKASRKGENFSRVKRTELANMMRTMEQNDESIYELPFDMDDTKSVVSVVTVDTERSSMVGIDRKGVAPTSEFLLLDVRTAEEFEACHITGAVHYPAVRVKRDQFPPEVYRFKNKPNKIIIVYAADESTLLGAQTAQAMHQKMFDNIYLLTGGLAFFGQKYPGRIIGEIPQDIRLPDPREEKLKGMTARQRRAALAKAKQTKRGKGRTRGGNNISTPGSQNMAPERGSLRSFSKINSDIGFDDSVSQVGSPSSQGTRLSPAHKHTESPRTNLRKQQARKRNNSRNISDKPFRI